jgi:hypothetical protein
MILDFKWNIGDRCIFVTVDDQGNEVKIPVKILNIEDEFYQIAGNYLEKFITTKNNKFYAHADELTFLQKLEVVK